MDRYLYSHYKGKYRVFPELDQDTLDFPRDEDGNIDDSYADFYLKGRSKIRITHGVGSELGCYIPSTGVGNNIIKDYCEKMTGKKYTIKEGLSESEKNKERAKIAGKAAKLLLEKGFINDIDFLDGELWFSFNAKHLDDLNEFVKLRTSGANISPLSSRNLPTFDYDLPKKDNELYKEAKEGIVPLKLGKLNSEFGNKIWKKNYNKLLKESHLKAIHFFHKEGKWNEYIEFLKGVER